MANRSSTALRMFRVKQQLHLLFSPPCVQKPSFIFLLGSFHLIFCFIQQPDFSPSKRLRQPKLISVQPNSVGRGKWDSHGALPKSEASPSPCPRGWVELKIHQGGFFLPVSSQHCTGEELCGAWEGCWMDGWTDAPGQNSSGCDGNQKSCGLPAQLPSQGRPSIAGAPVCPTRPHPRQKPPQIL